MSDIRCSTTTTTTTTTSSISLLMKATSRLKRCKRSNNIIQTINEAHPTTYKPRELFCWQLNKRNKHEFIKIIRKAIVHSDNQMLY
jgi:hypothetical protein